MPLNQALRKQSNVLWCISIIQDQRPFAQTKEEFSEMSKDILNTDTIESLTLCPVELLQRFRLMIQHGIGEEEAIQRCHTLKEQWYSDNCEEIERLRGAKKLNLLNWQEFLLWPDLSNTLYDLEKWYKEDRDFRNLVDGRVKQARESMPPDCKISNPIEQTVILKRYLFEECAFQKFAAGKGYNYEIYKTPMNKAMRRVKHNSDFVPPGVLVEVYFTQFMPVPKNDSPPRTHEGQNNGFSQVLSRNPLNIPALNGVTKPNSKPEHQKSAAQKVSEFIEKTVELIPEEQQAKAIDLLIKYATKEIIPLCYSPQMNDLKNI